MRETKTAETSQKGQGKMITLIVERLNRKGYSGKETTKNVKIGELISTSQTGYQNYTAKINGKVGTVCKGPTGEYEYLKIYRCNGFTKYEVIREV